MPHVLTHATHRRRFLQTAAGAVGAVLTARLAWADGEAHADHWALLSDTHIPENVEEEYRGFRPYENLRQIVPEIAKSKPAGTVIAGDVAQLEGLPGDYDRVKELIQPLADVAPTFMALGNHDDRGNFLKTFPEEAASGSRARAGGKHVLVVEQKPVRFIVLDSLFHVNEVAGLLGKAQRDWLAKYLADADDTPSVIFVHHTLGDGDGELLDVPRLFDIIDPVKKLKAIFFGHSHVYDYQERDGLHLINLPAVGYSFSDKQPVGWVEAEFSCTGATFQLHAVAGNTEADGQKTELQWR